MQCEKERSGGKAPFAVLTTIHMQRQSMQWVSEMSKLGRLLVTVLFWPADPTAVGGWVVGGGLGAHLPVVEPGRNGALLSVTQESGPGAAVSWHGPSPERAKRFGYTARPGRWGHRGRGRPKKGGKPRQRLPAIRGPHVCLLPHTPFPLSWLRWRRTPISRCFGLPGFLLPLSCGGFLAWPLAPLSLSLAGRHWPASSPASIVYVPSCGVQRAAQP